MLTLRRGLLLVKVAKVFGDTSVNVDDSNCPRFFVLYPQQPLTIQIDISIMKVKVL